MTAKRAVVLGAGGFIGHHLVNRLKKEGYFVRGVDRKYPEYTPTGADEFLIGDLKDLATVNLAVDKSFTEVYQLAADMGGAEYIFTGKNDAQILRNSAQINLNVAQVALENRIKALFYSSSACIYSEQEEGARFNQEYPKCPEDAAYPAAPDSEYGWEKLFSERLYFAYQRNHGLNVKVARFHNIFGPLGTWRGGREKAPAAVSRKVAEAKDGGCIEIWGDGKQTRSFLYIDECLEGVRRFMQSDFNGPLNIGSEELISINDLAKLLIEISGKKLEIKNLDGPVGVRGRNSDNRLITKKLGWSPSQPLRAGLSTLYYWVAQQVESVKRGEGGSKSG